MESFPPVGLTHFGGAGQPISYWQIDRDVFLQHNGLRRVSEDGGTSWMDYLGGELVAASDGEVIQFTSRYALWQQYGGSIIGDVVDVPLYLFSILAGEEKLCPLNFRQALFLDIETSIINEENCAIMVGLGAFEAAQFCLRQLFVTHPKHEHALLALLGTIVGSRVFLVTFNGKLFDVPFLDARFCRHGSEPCMSAFPHLDLLLIARRLWRSILPTCRLKTIEIERLGVERSDDIPSSMIPVYYRKFLETDEPQIVERLLLHNRFDVLSLLGTVNVMVRSLYHPATMDRREADLVACGKEFLRLGHAELATIYLEKAVKKCRTSEWEAVEELAQAYKRLRDWDRASTLWNDLINLDPCRSSYPYVELAKYYERRERDYFRAAKLMETAILNFPQQQTLMKRWERLRKKLS